MMDRPADRWQLDLLVRAANALEPNRIPPPIRIQEAIRLVFSRFGELGTARQVLLSMGRPYRTDPENQIPMFPES